MHFLKTQNNKGQKLKVKIIIFFIIIILLN